MPTKLEEELLALAAAERERREGASLPDPMGPQLLYTATLTAKGLQNVDPNLHVMTDPHIPEGVVFAVPSNSPLAADLRGGLQGGVSTGCTVEAAQRDEISVETLSRMFMGSEAQAQLNLRHTIGHIMDWGEGADETVPEPFGIEFDSDFEAATAPNEAVRFQVGRENPPHIGMNRGITATGGRVVSTRGEDGRFRSITAGQVVGVVEEGRIRPVGVAMASPVASTSTRPDPSPPRQTGRSTGPSGSQNRPTALERLVGKSPFDDD